MLPGWYMPVPFITRVVYACPVHHPGGCVASRYHGGVCSLPVPWWVCSLPYRGGCISPVPWWVCLPVPWWVCLPVPWWVYLPTIPLPIPWWAYNPCYTGHTRLPGSTLRIILPAHVRASAPAQSEVPDDNSLGSEEEVYPGWETFPVLKSVKVWWESGPLRIELLRSSGWERHNDRIDEG